MQEVGRAAARAAAAGIKEMPAAHQAALSAGSNDVGMTRASELQLGELGLLVLALLRMPDLFLYCHLLEASDLDSSSERRPPLAVARVLILSGAALRLAHRALESHMADQGSGFDTTVRLTDAFTHAARLLEDSAAMPDGSPLLLSHAHHALWALADAAAATSEPNPTVITQRLVDAIAQLLVVFTVTSQLHADEPLQRLAEA